MRFFFVPSVDYQIGQRVTLPIGEARVDTVLPTGNFIACLPVGKQVACIRTTDQPIEEKLT